MPSPNHRPKSSNSPLAPSLTGAALRRGDLTISDPIPFSQAGTAHPGSAPATMDTFPSTVEPPDSTWPRKSTPPRSHGRNASLGNGELSEFSRASVGPSIVPSSMSTAPSKVSLNQNKNGGIRATLKRIFRSKRHRPSVRDDRKGFYISDPGNLAAITEKQPDTRFLQAPSQPPGTVTRTSALGSHSPYSILSRLPRTSSERNRLISPRRRRRNTLPSLMLSDQEAQILAGPKDDLAIRAWKQVDLTKTHLKRRSRSADALNDMAATNDIVVTSTRDREDEIAYWRSSIVDNPVPQFEYYSQPESNRREPASSTQRQPGMMHAQTFDFGLGEPDSEPATLEQRINTLEVKLFDFEFALAKMQGNDIPKPPLYLKPLKRRSVHELFPEKGTNSPLNTSTKYDETFLASPDASPLPSAESDEIFRPNRSSKATTIRPSTSRRLSPCRSAAPSPSSPARLSPDQYEELMGLIRQEQDSRRDLQSQMAELKKEVEILRAPVFAEIRSLPYPTPSPESFHDNPAARTLHRTPAFKIDKPAHETSRFSMSDVESDTDDGDGFQDVYETPREDRFTFESTRGSPMVGVH